MKKSSAWLILSLCIAFLSCKKKDASLTCKLLSIDQGDGTKHSYIFDANGKITNMNRELIDEFTGNLMKYSYNFTYDDAGQLKKSTWLLNENENGSETYQYKNGKVVTVSYTTSYAGNGQNTLSYDGAGNISRFTFETGNKVGDGSYFFEYNVNNVLVKSGYEDAGGKKHLETIIKPLGLGKSAEVLLVNHGLPYDVLTGASWAKSLGKEGTTIEKFKLDDAGKLKTNANLKVINTKVNKQGFVVENTLTSELKKSILGQYILSDCK